MTALPVETPARTKTAVAPSNEEDFTAGKRITTTTGKAEVDREEEGDQGRGRVIRLNVSHNIIIGDIQLHP